MRLVLAHSTAFFFIPTTLLHAFSSASLCIYQLCVRAFVLRRMECITKKKDERTYPLSNLLSWALTQDSMAKNIVHKWHKFYVVLDKFILISKWNERENHKIHKKVCKRRIYLVNTQKKHERVLKAWRSRKKHQTTTIKKENKLKYKWHNIDSTAHHHHVTAITLQNICRF